MDRFFYLIPYLSTFVGLHCLSNAWVAILLYHVGMLAVLINRSFAWRSLWQGWRNREGVFLVMLGASSGIIILVFSGPLLGDTSIVAGRLNLLGLTGISWQAFSIYYCVANPILEEAFWRGFLGTSCSTVDRSDLFFAGYHILAVIFFVSLLISALSVLTLVLVAWIWRRQSLRHGGLAVPLVSHFAADLSIIVAASQFRVEM